MNQVTRRLKHIEWSLLSRVGIMACVRLVCPSNVPSDGYEQALSSQLAVLRGLRVDGKQRPDSVRVVPHGWPHDFISTQPDPELPAWAQYQPVRREVVSLLDSSTDEGEQ